MIARRIGGTLLGAVVFAAGASLLTLAHGWGEKRLAGLPSHYRPPAPARRDDGRVPVRVGYFPNVTHAQALVGLSDGTFERALGPGAALEAISFNAGPAAVEALLGGSIDLAYVGPNPVINAHLRARGTAVRVIAGAATGGSALVVRHAAAIRGPADLAGRRMATPQIGSTQDVAARHWLRENGVRGAQVWTLQNADALSLFRRGEIDAAWTAEPWVSRLVREAGGRVLVDERSLWPEGRYSTALLIVGTRFLEDHPDLVRRWLAAHVELTRRIEDDPAGAQAAVNAQLKRLLGQALATETLADAFGRFKVTWNPLPATLQVSADRAFQQGFLGKTPPALSGLFALDPLNEVLREAGLPTQN